MPLTKLSTDLNNHQSLADRPTQSPTQLKILFDKAVNDIKTFINNVLTEELDTFADSIPSTYATIETTDNMQTTLDGIPTTYATKAEVADIYAGGIADGSITIAKLDFDPATQTELDDVSSALTTHSVDYASHVPYGGTSTNVSNAYSISTPAISAYAAGIAVSFMCNADSTGASTLNVNSKGAVAIKKSNGTDVTNLKNNGVYTVRHNGTNFILQGEGASGNATASDLILGKTATVDAGEITGTGASAKRVANGTLTPALTGTPTDGKINLNLTGLSFQPSKLMMYFGETTYKGCVVDMPNKQFAMVGQTTSSRTTDGTLTLTLTYNSDGWTCQVVSPYDFTGKTFTGTYEAIE